MRRQKIGRSHNRDACPTRKVRYKTEKDANMAIKCAIEISGATGYVPIRSYLCSRCTGWHTASEQFR